MKIETLVVGQLQTNCYLVYDQKSRKTVIIDPGDDADFIIQRIKDLELKSEFILATHGHFDHVLAALELKLAFKIPFLIHKDDLFLVKRAVRTADYFVGDTQGFNPYPDKFIKEKDIISIGKNLQLKVIATPGHSPGGVSFYSRGVLFSGDTLFYNSFGRTDYNYGSLTDLKKSIKEKLFKLPDKTVVYSGHGPQTTIGQEKNNFTF